MDCLRRLDWGTTRAVNWFMNHVTLGYQSNKNGIFCRKFFSNVA